ncbi:MAG: hypothetical protein IJT90_06075 [Bacteroidaceae bacterium]|nr:hypothetical protein [Bacteroidaceae bacterium]
MHPKLVGASLRFIQRSNEVSIYKLDAPHVANQYYIASYKAAQRLLMHPEEVGFQTYLDLLPPTIEVLKWMKQAQDIQHLDILTILRGGLNYPVEEASHQAGIQVNNMNFLSCERIIENKKILRLEIKYQKYNIVDNGTILIGDIVATGDTLKECFNYVIERYRKRGGKLRRIIFFTVGGTRAFDLMEGFTERLREFWPDFEGFTCIFYEGIFSVYQYKGVTGVNVPNIDFYWHDSVLAPEYRRTVLEQDNVLFEKCIIYDGGARRYEIPEHYHEAMEYWRDIRTAADHSNMKAFVDEKIGYPSPTSFEEWLETNHYCEQTLSPVFPDIDSLRSLYQLEETFRQRSYKRDLKHIAEVRLSEIEAALGKYL